MHFFIAGCPRSGTTLLQQLLNRHPEVVIPPETGFFRDVAGRSRRRQAVQLARIADDLGIDVPDPGRRVTSPARLRELFDGIMDAYCRRAGRTGIRHYGEKTPRHVWSVDRIAEVFPDARMLLIQRDGRAVAASLSKVPWAHGDIRIDLSTWQWYARQQLRVLQAPPVATLVVCYEDLVTDPAAAVQRVADFLELDFDPALLAPADTDRSVPGWEMAWKAKAFGAPDPDRAEAWRRELDADTIATLTRLGIRELTALGYPTEDAAPPFSLPYRAVHVAAKAEWWIRQKARVGKAMLGMGDQASRPGA